MPSKCFDTSVAGETGGGPRGTRRHRAGCQDGAPKTVSEDFVDDDRGWRPSERTLGPWRRTDFDLCIGAAAIARMFAPQNLSSCPLGESIACVSLKAPAVALAMQPRAHDMVGT